MQQPGSDKRRVLKVTFVTSSARPALRVGEQTGQTAGVQKNERLGGLKLAPLQVDLTQPYLTLFRNRVTSLQRATFSNQYAPLVFVLTK
jgi:hypothetical protein